MYILLIDDWLLGIVIVSVVHWSALCLTHWRPQLNFCGKRNIFNFKCNAIMSIALIYNILYILYILYMSYITSDIIPIQITVGSGESCELSPRRPGFKSGWCTLLEDSYFMRIIKSNYNNCEEFIRCLDGALISSEVNTLNSSGCFLLVGMKKNIRVVIGRHEKKHKG